MISRRKFLLTTAAAAAWTSVVGRGTPILRKNRPRIYLSTVTGSGLRTVDDIRRSVQTGYSRTLWYSMLEKAELEWNKPPIQISDLLPGRPEASANAENPDYVVCYEAGQRILRNALVFLINGERRAKETALEQIAMVLDHSKWPDWIDQAHLRFGHPADLRTGMLGQDLALTYDWLHSDLSEYDRSWILEGIDRRAVVPYLRSIEQNPWWINDLNNWMTTIVGGLGVAGMALAEDHPESDRIISLARPLMKEYLTMYGPEGEFNESVAYANATIRPVAFDMALRYHSRGEENNLGEWPYRETSYWSMYMTVPPGRVAAFGDSHADAKPWTRHIAAIAAASRDSVLQWFYLNHANESTDPLDLLWFDASLLPENPRGSQPYGKAYNHHGKVFSMRTSWHPAEVECVVYGKAGREENHEHNDLGQLCIDAYGDRLVIDPGSPSGYPADFFEAERWNYYNASISGHNVLQIGSDEMKLPGRVRGEAADSEAIEAVSGSYLAARFSDALGGYCVMDLSRPYGERVSYIRTVVFLKPNLIAVLDEAAWEEGDSARIRWHFADMPQTADRSFELRRDRGAVSGTVYATDNQTYHSTWDRHSYHEPFNRDRLGSLLENRKEPFLEVRVDGKRLNLLTLFATGRSDEPLPVWKPNDQKAGEWLTSDGIGSVLLEKDRILMRNMQNKTEWQVRR